MVTRKPYLLLVPTLILALLTYVPDMINLFTSQDAMLGDWSYWSRCMKYCGLSWQVRYRNCSALHRGFGKSCEVLGPFKETRSCNLKPCPIDGGVGEWEGWTQCTKTCQGGYRERKRLCNNPEPNFNGLDCASMGFEKTEVKNCDEYTSECPIDGVYDKWTSWSECSKTCDSGIQYRYQECIPPKYNGKFCEPPKRQENRTCNIDSCPTTTTTTSTTTSATTLSTAKQMP